MTGFLQPARWVPGWEGGDFRIVSFSIWGGIATLIAEMQPNTLPNPKIYKNTMPPYFSFLLMDG
jgi:hypothetical protein